MLNQIHVIVSNEAAHDDDYCLAEPGDVHPNDTSAAVAGYSIVFHV